MQYVEKFIGGPFDGDRRGAYKNYSTLTMRQHVEAGLTNMAIYEYGESIESNGITERVFIFRKTVPIAEGHAILERESRSI
jgi:hypothetical protein